MRQQPIVRNASWMSRATIHLQRAPQRTEREMPVAASLAVPVGTTIVLPGLGVIILIILIIWLVF
jgi:hypothetical protein